MNDFVKIKYTITFFDLEVYAPGAREVIEILPNGDISIKTYSAGSRKIKEKANYHASEHDVRLLMEELRRCIDNAESNLMFTDDSDAVLEIFYDFGRTESMPRGLGSRYETVGEIIMKFVSQYQSND